MPMKVTLFDYGTGNLHSLAKALEAGGARVQVEADPTAAVDADALVLPGVGAFGAAAARLSAAAGELRAALDDGFPCLGICLGMQLLFDGSEEGPGVGLGVVPGRVRRLRAARVPQMGWNGLEPARQDDPPVARPPAPASSDATPPDDGLADPLFAGLFHRRGPGQATESGGGGERVAHTGPVVYYANSFVGDPEDPSSVIAWTTYDGDRFAAAVRAARTWGVQFHPEKSSVAGLQMVRNFLEEVAR